MSCQNEFPCWQERPNTRPSTSGGCVEDTVRRIIDAQKKAASDDAGRCITSCDQSIEDLLSPSHTHRPTRYTTIPFMLQCKDNCSTFVASGFTSRDSRGDRDHHFRCVSSPVFKVRGFVRGNEHCVRLELLEPIYERGQGPGGDDDGCSKHSICGTFGKRPIRNFRYTGVCITVDLRCFCGITCLDPITPAPVR